MYIQNVKTNALMLRDGNDTNNNIIECVPADRLTLVHIIVGFLSQKL